MSYQRTEDPLVSSISSEFVKVHKAAGRNVLSQAFDFTSFTESGCSGRFFCNTSSVIDRALLLEATVVLTTSTAHQLKAKSVNAAGLSGALRAFPLCVAMKQLDIVINGTSTGSVSPQECIAYMQRDHTGPLHKAFYWGQSPSYCDPFSAYGKLKPTTSINYTVYQDPEADPLVVVGEVAVEFPNPLSPFCSEQFFQGPEHSRLSFPFLAETDLTRTYKLVEPLLHPLCGDGSDTLGLTNVSSIEVLISWENDLKKIYSGVAQPAGFSVSIGTIKPKLYITSYEPDEETKSKLPLVQYVPVVYPSVNVVPAASAMAINGASQQTMTVTLGQVPSRFVIFLRDRDSTRGVTRADGFATITKVNMTIANRGGILADKQPQQLYTMSRDNGLNMTYLQFSKRLGSVVIADSARDLSLIAGALGSFQVTINVDYTNTQYSDIGDVDTGANPTSYDLYMICEQSGVLSISTNGVNRKLGLEASDILAASKTEKLNVKAENPQGITGSGFAMHGGGEVMGGSFASFWRGVKRFARPILKVGSKLLPFAGPVAESLLGSNNRVAQALNSDVMNSVANAINPQQKMIEGQGFQKTGFKKSSGLVYA